MFLREYSIFFSVLFNIFRYLNILTYLIIKKILYIFSLKSIRKRWSIYANSFCIEHIPRKYPISTIYYTMIAKMPKKRTKQTNNTNLSLSNRWRLPQFICSIVCICFTFNCAHNLLMYFLQRVSCFEVFFLLLTKKKLFFLPYIVVQWLWNETKHTTWHWHRKKTQAKILYK